MDKIKSIAVPVTRRPATKAKRAGHPTPPADTQVGGSVGEFRRQPRVVAGPPIHRYRIGQRLAMSRGSLQLARDAAVCTVVSLVPHEQGPLLYRVRSEAETFERTHEQGPLLYRVRSEAETFERIVDENDLAPFQQLRP